MSIWRSFNVPLRGLVSAPEYSKIERIFDYLWAQAQKQYTKKNTNILLKQATLKSNGVFRNEYNQLIGKPHLKWKIPGDRAKYQRMIIENYRHLLISSQDRLHYYAICKAHKFDPSQFQNILGKLHEEGHYPTHAHLRNVLKSKQPSLPAHLPFTMDYTTGDKQIIKREAVGSTIQYSIKFDTTWTELVIPIPAHLRENTGAFTNPIIQKDEHGELYARIAYEAKIAEIPEADNHATGAVMGVDLGLRKPFSSAILYTDGSYSAELTMSKETQRIAEKIALLKREATLNYAKADAISKLLVNHEDLYLAQHYEDVRAQARALRSKVAVLKEALSWLSARDVVAHAKYHKIKRINLEKLSWLGSVGGTWDHSQMQSKITQVAELNGITIELVNSKDTSHTNPFTNEPTNPKNDRLVDLGEGFELDRDYVAALEIARRSKKSSAKRKATPKACRDKRSATPKRPRKIVSAKRAHKLNKKKNIGSGLSIAVVTSPEVREITSDITPRNYSAEAMREYSQVLQ